MFKFVKGYFLKFINSIIILSIFFIISWSISLMLPSISGKFIDLLVYQNDKNIIKKYIFIFISVSFFNILISYLMNMSMLKLQTKMAFNVNFDLIEHLKKIPFLKIIKYDPVYLNQRINTDSNILITFFLNNFLNFFFNIVTIVISFSILYSINSTLAMVLVFLVPFYILSYMLLKNRLYKLNLKNKETQDKFFSDLTEQITNIKSIKINSSFELYKNKAEKSFKDMFINLINLSKTSYFSSGLDNILSIIATSIVFFIGGLKIINNELSIGEFTIITTYFSKIVGTISYYLNNRIKLIKQKEVYKYTSFCF